MLPSTDQGLDAASIAHRVSDNGQTGARNTLSCLETAKKIKQSGQDIEMINPDGRKIPAYTFTPRVAATLWF